MGNFVWGGRICIGKGNASNWSDFTYRPGGQNRSTASNWSDLPIDQVVRTVLRLLIGRILPKVLP